MLGRGMRGERGFRSSAIICSNLIEFGQVIVRDHLWDSLTK